jgi:hypothetical protein
LCDAEKDGTCRGCELRYLSLPDRTWSSQGIHWVAILSAVAAVLSAGVLLAGAWFARLYLLRVTARVEATCHPLPNGLLLHVRPSIRSAGLTRTLLLNGEDERPLVSVAEHRLSDSKNISSGLVVGTLVSQPAFVQDEVVDPGETISDSVYFLMSPQVAATLGWRVRFRFSVKKQRGHGEWVYVAATFVPTPFDSDKR